MNGFFNKKEGQPKAPAHALLAEAPDIRDLNASTLQDVSKLDSSVGIFAAKSSDAAVQKAAQLFRALHSEVETIVNDKPAHKISNS